MDKLQSIDMIELSMKEFTEDKESVKIFMEDNKYLSAEFRICIDKNDDGSIYARFEKEVKY